jgi:RNA polymerase sigma factor (sigma-70 family)
MESAQAPLGPGSQQHTVSDETARKRQALFKQYVTPYLRMIYKLCIRYSFKQEYVQDNYVDALANLYRYIETYDPTRPLHTWLHACTKRCVFDLDRKRQAEEDMRDKDDDIESYADDEGWEMDSASSGCMNMDNYRELYSDDVLYALDQLKPQYRRPFLLQQAGYRLKEIAEIEYRNGALDSKNIETVKSRLFLARRQMRKILTRDGTRRTD